MPSIEFSTPSSGWEYKANFLPSLLCKKWRVCLGRSEARDPKLVEGRLQTIIKLLVLFQLCHDNYGLSACLMARQWVTHFYPLLMLLLSYFQIKAKKGPVDPVGRWGQEQIVQQRGRSRAGRHCEGDYQAGAVWKGGKRGWKGGNQGEKRGRRGNERKLSGIIARTSRSRRD